MNLAVEVPEKPEGFTFNLKNPHTPGSPIPVYNYYQGRFSYVGTVPEGGSIKIDQFDIFNKTHYYAMPRPSNISLKNQVKKNLTKSKVESEKTVWVPGFYIKATSVTSAAK